jgi:hypothetical protein
MDYYHNTSASDTQSTHPNQHDYAELVTIYTDHLDSTSTVGQASIAASMPPAMHDIDLAGPRQWGKLIRHNGRTALYHLDFGGGNKVLTLVIWAVAE